MGRKMFRLLSSQAIRTEFWDESGFTLIECQSLHRSNLQPIPVAVAAPAVGHPAIAIPCFVLRKLSLQATTDTARPTELICTDLPLRQIAGIGPTRLPRREFISCHDIGEYLVSLVAK